MYDDMVTASFPKLCGKEKMGEIKEKKEKRKEKASDS